MGNVKFRRVRGRIVPIRETASKIGKASAKDAAQTFGGTMILAKVLEPKMPFKSLAKTSLKYAAGWGLLSLGVRSLVAIKSSQDRKKR